MRPVPVTDRAVETHVQVEGKEEHGPIVEVRQNVYDGVDHAAKDEG